MRTTGLLLLLILLSALPLIGDTADLVETVPSNNSAYTQLISLYKFGIIPSLPDKLRDSGRTHPLTRYDVAFLLVEPLERCVAFVRAQESSASLQPEQRRRAEMIYLTFSKLPVADMNQAISMLTQLLDAFGPDIDQLSPGMSTRAASALQKLKQPSFRPWIKTSDGLLGGMPVIHLSINPNAQTDSLNGGPLAFIAPQQGGREALFARKDSPSVDTGMIGSRPVSSLEAAVDIAFPRLRVYGSVGTLPVQDPMASLMRADGSGKAMLGVEVDIAHIKYLGISSIFEFHIMRSGDPTDPDTNTGAVGGIGLNW